MPELVAMGTCLFCGHYLVHATMLYNLYSSLTNMLTATAAKAICRCTGSVFTCDLNSHSFKWKKVNPFLNLSFIHFLQVLATKNFDTDKKSNHTSYTEQAFLLISVINRIWMLFRHQTAHYIASSYIWSAETYPYCILIATSAPASHHIKLLV